MKLVTSSTLCLIISSIQAAYTQPEARNVSCITNIEKFSSGASRSHYYDCGGDSNGLARLMSCPEGQYYHTKKQTCIPHSEKDVPEEMEMKALGRNVQLGTLYDARTNMFYPETSFWTKDTIDHESVTVRHPSLNVDYHTDQRTLNKMEHMDIHASLEMDFMSGMVHVKGGADYLKDTVTNEYEVNVEMTYDTTVVFQYLPKPVPDYLEECADQQFTHVVTGVTYGLSCVFVFKSLQTDESEISSVAGDLEAAIKNIPSFSASGEIHVNLTESQQKTLETTYLRMFGDISPKYPLPTTFDEAIDFYGKLPEMLTEDEEGQWQGATIVSLNLVPVTDICSDEERILNEISEQMMNEVKNLLDDLEQLNMKAGVLHDSVPAQKFKPLRENFNLYIKALKSYEIETKRQLQTILPNIRGGNGMGEDALTDLVISYHDSQFLKSKSESFLRDRTREKNAINVLVDYFAEETNLGLADYENAHDVEYIFERDFVIVLEVNILTPSSLTQDFLDGKTTDESNFWFHSNTEFGKLREALKAYYDFALDNVDQGDRGYLLKISPYDNTTTYRMNAFVKGHLISSNFEAPRKPKEKPETTQINHDGFQFKIKKPNAFVIGVRMLINDTLDDQYIEQDILFPSNATTESDIEVQVKKLEMAKVYFFSVKYLTEVGTSPASPTSETFNTAPFSAPNHLSARNVTDNSITLTWGKPSFYAAGIYESLIKYNVSVTGGNKSENVTTASLEHTFTDLTGSTQYQFTVRAFYKDLDLPDIDNENTESAPAVIDVFSSPEPPSIDDPTEVSERSAKIFWVPPEIIGTGVKIVHYVLKYTNATSYDASGNAASKVVVNQTYCELTDLAMGTDYKLQIMMVTSEGKSSFSKEIGFQTLYTPTVMGNFTDRVYGAIGDIVDNINRESQFCAFKQTTNKKGTLTYDSIDVNTTTGVDGAGLDPETGLFTAGWAGSYHVVVNLVMVSSWVQQHSVWVVLNGKKVDESYMKFSHDSYNYGDGTDNASRDIILNLNVNDKVGLYHETDGDGALLNVKFCVYSLKLIN